MKNPVLGLGLFSLTLAQDGLDATTSTTTTTSFAPGVCSEGVYDCAYEFEGDDENDPIFANSPGCANYNGAFPDPQNLDGIMAMAGIFGALMAFGIGANDAANMWATSVGSGAIGVTKAVLLCGFFEWLGATTLGYGVSKTIQKGVASLDAPDCWACGYCNSEITVAMGGSLGALIGASLFLLLTSGTGMPVSTTHAIVGGVVGMTMTGAGAHCLNWKLDGGLGGIVMSWVLSPLLSAIISSTGYTLSKKFIIKSKNPRRNALRALPVIYAFCLFCTFMMGLLKAKAIKSELTLFEKLIISAAAAAVLAAILYYFATKAVIDHLPSENGTSELYLKGARLARSNYKKYQQTETEMTTQGESKPSPESDLLGSSLTENTPSAEDEPAQTTSRGKTVDANEVIVMERIDNGEAGASKETKLAVSNPQNGKDHPEAAHQVTKFDLFPPTNKMNALAAPEVTAEKNLDEEEEVTMGRNLADAETVGQLDAIFVFRFILVLNACLESYAHGSNDTANATGPFSAVYQFYSSGRTNCDSDEGTMWILSIAGVFVAIGVCTFGYKVMKTIGKDLTVIDYHKGFWIEFASTMATMVATVLEFPVSTTHCQVGGVVGVGIVTWMQGVGKVSWPLFGKIFLSWILTLPISGSIAAVIALAIKGSLVHY